MAKELEETYEALLAENKVLKTNLQACEANLQSFVNEMNSLLDQHELGSVVGQALVPNDVDLANVGAPLNSHHHGAGFNESPLGADQIYSRGDNSHATAAQAQAQAAHQNRNHLGETGGH